MRASRRHLRAPGIDYLAGHLHCSLKTPRRVPPSFQGSTVPVSRLLNRKVASECSRHRLAPPFLPLKVLSIASMTQEQRRRLVYTYRIKNPQKARCAGPINGQNRRSEPCTRENVISVAVNRTRCLHRERRCWRCIDSVGDGGRRDGVCWCWLRLEK